MHLQKSNTMLQTHTKLLSQKRLTQKPTCLHRTASFQNVCSHAHLINTIQIVSVGFTNYKVIAHYDDFYFALN